MGDYRVISTPTLTSGDFRQRDTVCLTNIIKKKIEFNHENNQPRR